MDFIPFNHAETNKTDCTTKQQSKTKLKQNFSTPIPATNKLAFGSPAVGMPAFGSPAVSFGRPAVQTANFVPLNRTPSPRHNSSSPGYHRMCNSPNSLQHQGYKQRPCNSPNTVQNQNSRNSQNNYNRDNSFGSPRNQYNNNNTPRHNVQQKYSPYGQRDGNNFKTPHQFSPQGQRGRSGFGRKSMSWTFGQTPGFNANPSGSLFIEEYYNPKMVEDPWRNLTPKLAQT